MLVLSRVRDESIVCRIPNDLPAGAVLKITVVDVRGDKVRLGFEAPAELVIDREEVDLRKQPEQ